MSKPWVWILAGLITVAWTISAVTGSANVETALERQLQMVTESPNSASGYNDLGNLLALADRLDDAEEAYRRAIELDPSDSGPRFNLGVLLQQRGNNREASQAYQNLLEVEPQHAWANYQLGTILEQRGDRSRAIERYARAFAADPTLTFAEYNPHIIDNSLATEAMLTASKYSDLPKAAIPRLYAAPERIAQWMLERHFAEDGELAGSVDEDGGTMPVSQGAGSGPQDAPEGTSASDGPDEPRAAGRQLTSDDLQTSSVGQAKSGSSSRRRYSPGSSSSGLSRGRTGSVSRPPETLPSGRLPSTNPSSRRGTVQEDAADSRNNALRSRQIGSSPRPDRNTQRPGTSVIPGATLQRDYRSSRLSTGRLELELLPPEAPAERLAQAALPAPGAS